MKTNLTATLLVALLVFSVAATAVLAFAHVQSARKLQRLQGEAAEINRNRAQLQALAAETLEYSKRNPAIDPLLQTVGIKPKAAAGNRQN
jgi:membrane protein insertase Oxa1/YidC/SpoIIIJ